MARFQQYLLSDVSRQLGIEAVNLKEALINKSFDVDLDLEGLQDVPATINQDGYDFLIDYFKKDDEEINNQNKEKLVNVSDEILLYLLSINEEDPNFKFWLRQKDSTRSEEIRLKNGQWFQGSDYIYVGFYGLTDNKNKTQTIGFVLTFESAQISQIYLEIAFPNEGRKEFQLCYETIARKLTSYFSNSKGMDFDSSKFFFEYSTNDWNEAIDLFLNRDKKTIDETILEHGLTKDFEIPDSKFKKMLANTLSIRKELYGSKSSPKNEQVNLQTESLEVEDKLGRKPFVDSLKTYINKLWSEKKDSYAIHLGGEWGSGKSKVLNMLASDLEKEDWVVIEFNAWQNQHLDPPWWVFMDNVYLGIQNSKNHRWGIWWQERYWRLFVINKLYWLSFFALAAVFIVLNVFTGFDSLKLVQLLNNVEDGNNIISLILSYTTLIGSVWVFFKAITGSLILATSDVANDFKSNVRDPMRELKNHFGKIINYTKKNVAVFIDDIDRCNPPFVVKLLEGIQTLFRPQKVLYIVAGDGNWIKKSFEVYYDDLKDVVKKPGHDIGNFFIEKTFQMSIKIPQISDETKELFWRHLLNGDVDDTRETELIEEIDKANTEEEIDNVVKRAATPEEKVKVRTAAVKRMSEKEDILGAVEHKLIQYHKLLEPNPRSMKRLINNYALERKSMILSGIGFDQVSDDNLIKWVILQSRFPLIADELSKDPKKLSKLEIDESTGTIKEISKGLTPEVLKFCVRR
ncbi:MAG: P-loop NTPase fold protein [Cyclobacteriaceae bacterium]